MKDYSHYYDFDINQKIKRDGLLILERSLNGFQGYDAIINSDIHTRVLLFQKWNDDGASKKVIGRIEEIERGNLIQIDSDYWLVVTVPIDNKFYRKANVVLCNNTFHILSNKTQVLLRDENGNIVTDRDGRPVYKWVYEIDKHEPCIVERTYKIDEERQFVLPEGQIRITMQYQKADNIIENSVFDMYNEKYKIMDIDYTKVINNKGIMIITAVRVQGE